VKSEKVLVIGFEGKSDGRSEGFYAAATEILLVKFSLDA